MLRRSIISAVAVGGLALMAIGSGGTGLPSADPAANQAACETYWNAYNELECLPGGFKLDAADLCSNVNNPYVDMTGYYGCMQEKAICTDGSIDVTGQTECNDLLTP
ncbi:MAG: hypothetical protein AB8H79_00575 [Myxococcota bacterium]